MKPIHKEYRGGVKEWYGDVGGQSHIPSVINKG